MCGRFASTLPIEQLARLFAVTEPRPNSAPNWNLAPTQPAAAVRRHPESGKRVLSLLTWGLLPSFAKADGKGPRPINARAETVATNALFRGAFARRRCLIPADAYYEWHTEGGRKQPYAVARADGAPLALGGLWEGHRAPDETVTRSFAIVTVPADVTLADLHPRMPLVLEPGNWAAWLGETETDPLALLRPNGGLRAWRVSARVNNARNNEPGLLVAEAEGGLPGQSELGNVRGVGT
jgi:putative SOS response-associated peptidase YedK